VDGILLATWLAAGVVVVLYVLFVIWRLRVHRRRKSPKRTEEVTTDDRLARALDAAARISGQAPQPLLPPAHPDAVPTSSTGTEPTSVGAPARRAPGTVADLLKGIRLPHELAPLTTMAPRAGAGDRVAFWTDLAGAENVGPAFVDELRRIGCEVTQIDVTSFAVIRDDMRALAMFHPDGRAARIDDSIAFPSVPASVVVEIWLST
jgi:hypothetical protein